MNRQQSFTLIAVTCLAVVLLTMVDLRGQAAGGAKPASVAVIDVQAVFGKLEEKAAIEADIQVQADRIQKEEQERQTEVKALQSDLNILRPESPAYNQTQEKLNKKLIEFEVWRQYTRKQLESENTIRIESLYRKVVDAVGSAAKRQGYDLVLYKDQTTPVRGKSQQEVAAKIQLRKVLYSDARLDITEPITQQLNAEYKKAKSGG
ncbi:MAG: OmpH family outer membrane protein [Phycisphaerae bacterium]|nr:OmpH family outer membrane protein [Phycisphaerae bacterium]